MSLASFFSLCLVSDKCFTIRENKNGAVLLSVLNGHLSFDATQCSMSKDSVTKED